MELLKELTAIRSASSDEGKMKKFFSESCLMEQAYVKNPDITVQDLLNELMAKTGENIVISRFSRFQLGDAGE